MKTAILLHGTDGSDTDYYWFAETKTYLEKHGYDVWWPLLPHTEKPELAETLSFVLDNMPTLDTQSIVVGHSSACPLILSLLEHIPTPIAKAVLVSGFYQEIDDQGYSRLMLQSTYRWQEITTKAKEIYLLNSDNDPWGCHDEQARSVAEKIATALIVMFGQGHMGSDRFDQPYRDFPLLKRLLS